MRYKKDKNSLIRYKWETGVYGLEEVKQLVKQGVITKEQFFDITRHYYNESNKEKKIQNEST